jgi:hypothetical protein
MTKRLFVTNQTLLLSGTFNLSGNRMSKQKKVKKKAFANKPQSQNRPASKKQDSVFTEAWENMSEDFAKVMPSFLQKGLKGGKRKVWVMVAITFIELVVLGAVGKFIYDWFIES